MAEPSKSKPLMPVGCWQIPLLMLVGGGLYALLGDRFGLVLAILVIGAMIADLAMAARRDGAWPLPRIGERMREYALLSAIALLAALHFFSQ